MKLNGNYSMDDLKNILRENAMEYFASKGPQITNSEAVISYLEAVMINPEKELFGVLYLDNRHNILHFEIIFEGTIDMSAVYPREICKQALFQNAAAILVCHNHPGGSVLPSQDDLKVTEKIKKALETLSMRLLDHLIFGAPGNSYSFREHGDL